MSQHRFDCFPYFGFFLSSVIYWLVQVMKRDPWFKHGFLQQIKVIEFTSYLLLQTFHEQLFHLLLSSRLIFGQLSNTWFVEFLTDESTSGPV